MARTDPSQTNQRAQGRGEVIPWRRRVLAAVVVALALGTVAYALGTPKPDEAPVRPKEKPRAS
jgi:hypothetical protein